MAMQSGAQPNELRLESRSNIFVMAALYANEKSVTPVRVRNLSRTGALVEAAALPPAGTTVRLSRASLTAFGTVMWVDGHKAGLQFAKPIATAEWMPQGKRGMGQQFVDELFHQKRVRADTAQDRDGTAAANPAIADELLVLKHSLERAAEELALDPAVASRHLAILQAIDGIGRALERMAIEATVSTSIPAAKRA